MESINQMLLALGLEGSEIKLYRYCLQSGPQRADDLSDICFIPKLSTYAAINSLLGRGLMSKFLQDDDIFYNAEHPKNIVNYFENYLTDKKELLKTFKENVFELEAEVSDEKPSIKFFEGKDGLKTMQRDFLDSNVEEAVMFFPLHEVKKVFSDEERDAVGLERREKGIKIKVIYTSDQKQSSLYVADNITEEKQISEIDFPLGSDITIYGNKVMMASLKGKLNGVIIESDSIADSLRSIFKLAYKGADKTEK